MVQFLILLQRLSGPLVFVAAGLAVILTFQLGILGNAQSIFRMTSIQPCAQ